MQQNINEQYYDEEYDIESKTMKNLKNFFKKPIDTIREISEGKNINVITIIVIFLCLFFMCFLSGIIDYWCLWEERFAEKIGGKIGTILSESVTETALLILLVSGIVYFLKRKNTSFKLIFSTFVVSYSPMILVYLIEITLNLLGLSSLLIWYFPFEYLTTIFSYIGMSVIFKEEMSIWKFVLVFLITNILCLIVL